MFESMSAFLWFFFITLGLSVLSVLFEEKLIAFEGRVFAFLKWLTKSTGKFIRLCVNSK